MIDQQTGALAAEGVTPQIGPSMTQAAFLASKWGQSAIDADDGGYKGGFYPPPWRYWNLAGKYCSMSLSLAVTLTFHGEQLVRLELWHDDGKKSWGAEPAADEQRRIKSHEAWVSACLGERRSFPWGTVSLGHGSQVLGGATIIITYSAYPKDPFQSSRAGTNPPGESMTDICKAAEQGSAEAQFSLGLLYANGRGVPKDENTAVAWYAKAAEQGYANAEYNLGVMYDNGRGVPKDENTAVAWYAKAAEQGYANAQYNLGVMYDNGRGVPKDENTAVAWYAKAAEQGYANAQYNLGVMYDNGRGVAKDAKRAVLWYTKAAKQGSANAQFNLGTMYADGRGVTQDIVSAHLWFLLAARTGHSAAVKHRDLTAAQMTPVQLSGAQGRAQRCIDSNYKDFH
jgi:TPR repeat protein